MTHPIFTSLQVYGICILFTKIYVNIIWYFNSLMSQSKADIAYGLDVIIIFTNPIKFNHSILFIFFETIFITGHNLTIFWWKHMFVTTKIKDGRILKYMKGLWLENSPLLAHGTYTCSSTTNLLKYLKFTGFSIFFKIVVTIIVFAQPHV